MSTRKGTKPKGTKYAWGAIVALCLGGSGCVDKVFGDSLGATGVNHLGTSDKLAEVDRRADPCQDFASYACGVSFDRLTRKHVLPLLVAITRFLTKAADGSYQDGTTRTAALGEMYRRCDNLAARESSLQELGAELDRWARVRTLDELAAGLGALVVDSGVRLLIELGAGPVDDRGQPRPGLLTLADPALPRQAYTFEQHPSALQRHWQRLGGVRGFLDPREAEVSAAIDAQLATVPAIDTADFWAMPLHRIDRASLRGRRFPWSTYLTALKVPPAAPLVTSQADFLDRVDALFATPLDHLKAYVRVSLLERWAALTTGDLVRIEQDYHHGGPTGLKAQYACALQTWKVLEPELARAYLPVLAHPASERRSRELFATLRDGLLRRLDAADWMDPPSRREAIATIRGTTLTLAGGLAAPEAQPPAPVPGSMLSLVRSIRAWRLHVALEQIGRPPNMKQIAPSFQVATYTPALNTVWLSPLMVRPPFLRTVDFDPISFGAVGSTLGHELTHAIWPGDRPTYGLTKRVPWPDAMNVALDTRAACVQQRFEYFGKWPAGQAQRRLRAGENLADLTGLKVALAAMQAEGVVGDRLVLAEREFFLGYAQGLCAWSSEATSEFPFGADEHEPTRARINAVVANTPAFARAYGCTAGAPLAPEDRCEVW